MKKAFIAFVLGILLGDKTLAFFSWLSGIVSGLIICKVFFH